MTALPFDIIETIASFFIEQPCTYKGWAESGCVLLCLRKWPEGQQKRLKKAMFQMVYGKGVNNTMRRGSEYIITKGCQIPDGVPHEPGYAYDGSIRAYAVSARNNTQVAWYRRDRWGVHICVQSLCRKHMLYKELCSPGAGLRYACTACKAEWECSDTD